MKLSEYVKQYRKEHGMSLRVFAEQCGCSHQYLDRLEKDQIATPSLGQLKNIASAMGMPVHELLDQVDDVSLQIYSDAIRESIEELRILNRQIQEQKADISAIYNKLNPYNQEILKMMAETMLKKQEK